MRVLILTLCLLCAGVARADDLVVSEWLVLGTVPFEKDVDPFDEPVPAELLAEGPDDGDVFEGMRWTASPATEDGLVDLIGRGLDPQEFCSAYLHAYVFSPETGSATVSVGSDDGIQVFVNGTEVHRNWTLRGFVPNQDEFPVRLGSGWNRLLLRVANYSGGFGASAAVLEADRLESVAARPADYVAVRTPPWLDLVDSRPEPRLVRDDGGGLALKILSELRNLGTDAAPDVVLRVTTTDGNVDSAATFVIPPGRSELALVLDPERVARSVATGAGLRLRLEHDGPVGTDEVAVDAGVRDFLGIVTGKPALRNRIPVGSESIARLLKSWRWGQRFRPDLFENEGGFRALLSAYLDEDDRSFGQQWGNLRHEMKRGAEAIRAQRITFVGNSHIDMAWLWDREETKEVVELTYDQALKFIDEFSFFNYAQS
ncbi:MAG: glycoside hydrolase family 38 N-terminal domain-containing protein, partial [Planctomycetota bacterium]